MSLNTFITLICSFTQDVDRVSLESCNYRLRIFHLLVLNGDGDFGWGFFICCAFLFLFFFFFTDSPWDSHSARPPSPGPTFPTRGARGSGGLTKVLPQRKVMVLWTLWRARRSPSQSAVVLNSSRVLVALFKRESPIQKGKGISKR